MQASLFAAPPGPAQQEYGFQQAVAAASNVPLEAFQSPSLGDVATQDATPAPAGNAAGLEPVASIASSSRGDGPTARRKSKAALESDLEARREERNANQAELEALQHYAAQLKEGLKAAQVGEERVRQELRTYSQLEEAACQEIDAELTQYLTGFFEFTGLMHLGEQLRRWTAGDVRQVKSWFWEQFSDLLKCHNKSDVEQRGRKLQESYLNMQVRCMLFNPFAVEREAVETNEASELQCDTQQDILNSLGLHESQLSRLAAVWSRHKPNHDRLVSDHATVVWHLPPPELVCESDHTFAARSLADEGRIDVLLNNSRLESVRKCAVMRDVLMVLNPRQTAALVLQSWPHTPDFRKITLSAFEQEELLSFLDRCGPAAGSLM